MEQRLKLEKVQPEALEAMFALEKYINSTEIDTVLKELIKIRASQLNGCSFCLDMHTKDARQMGETERRIFAISVWRDSPFFTEEEKIVLELTEEITHISQKGITDTTYKKAIETFGEVKTAQLIMIAVTINAWNRIGVGLRMIPE